MSVEQLLALSSFVIVMTGTPGPNNMMLLSSGANFGFRRSIPHILGITVGCQILLVAVALGLGQLLLTYPPAALALKVLCGAVLLYLAWQLLRSPGVSNDQTLVSRPLSFFQAAMFQWVNPKAWLMMVTVITTYTQPNTIVSNTALIALLFVVLGLPLISIWNLFGTSLRALLQHPKRLRVFNAVMAVALLGSMYPLLV
jgi:threonine/homoserine/homoserine lactone efflux protein